MSDSQAYAGLISFVARAYVAVAGVENDVTEAVRDDEAKKSALLTDTSLKKLQPGVSASAGSSLEGQAVDRYLDDEEWEKDMRSRGLGPRNWNGEVPSFRWK